MSRSTQLDRGERETESSCHEDEREDLAFVVVVWAVSTLAYRFSARTALPRTHKQVANVTWDIRAGRLMRSPLSTSSAVVAASRYWQRKRVLSLHLYCCCASFVLACLMIVHHQPSHGATRERERERILHTYSLSSSSMWAVKNKKKWNLRMAAVTRSGNFTSSSLSLSCVERAWACSLASVLRNSAIAVQIFKINFHSFADETIDERSLVCLHKERKST